MVGAFEHPRVLLKPDRVTSRPSNKRYSTLATAAIILLLCPLSPLTVFSVLLFVAVVMRAVGVCRSRGLVLQASGAKQVFG